MRIISYEKTKRILGQEQEPLQSNVAPHDDWIHQYDPASPRWQNYNASADEDPPSEFIQCPFGRNGHLSTGRLLSQRFKALDTHLIPQVQAATFQHHLTQFSTCTMIENHPPSFTNQVIFWAHGSGDGIIVQIREVIIDLCIPMAPSENPIRINVEGLCDQAGHSYGNSKFSVYLSSLLSGKPLIVR